MGKLKVEELFKLFVAGRNEMTSPALSKRAVKRSASFCSPQAATILPH